jgi:hypothetical protein
MALGENTREENMCADLDWKSTSELRVLSNPYSGAPPAAKIIET